ncbi:MAG: DNA recombination protein RmuC [Bacteroidota bacterium]
MDILLLFAGLLAGIIPGILLVIKYMKEKEKLSQNLENAQKQIHDIENQSVKNLASLNAQLEFNRESLKEKEKDRIQLKNEFAQLSEDYQSATNELAKLRAENKTLEEKLKTQKQEIEELGKKFNTEFENIANRIFEEKSTRFAFQNKENLQNILKPLGDNIENFRKKVEEVYTTEAKERFSLGKELEKLLELNHKVSEEANNLTQALKGSAKVQGDWGEMILKNILEESGLQEGREYYLQEYITDEQGNTLKNEEGKKMRPDVIIKYPDQRKVIIDSKVSLVAYTRYMEAAEEAKRQISLKEHIFSVKSHIDSLSSTGYIDMRESLDFVMMFIPVEPAFLLALKEDPNLWSYAYKKKILLISPTNLIAVLKLIEDLWKREYQNQNAIAIADRGASLYDKFVSFVDNLEDVGKNIHKASESYQMAFKQLKTGRGNLISQAENLKDLGIKSKKSLRAGLADEQ